MLRRLRASLSGEDGGGESSRLDGFGRKTCSFRYRRTLYVTKQLSEKVMKTGLETYVAIQRWKITQ